MRRVTVAAALLLATGCAVPVSQAPPPEGNTGRISPASAGAAGELMRLHESVRVNAIETRRFTHQQYWSALNPIIDDSPHLHREEVGRSAEGRMLQAVTYGTGPVTVLLWSQMHGDESTASMSLLDLFHHLGRSPDDAFARLIRERLTLVVLPMLNPDGAERFQRRNALGVDVNRDARMLATPEGYTLRAIHQRYQPSFGFNLHDQNPRIRVGSSQRVAAISLLAPPFDEARSDNLVRDRARQLAGLLRGTAEALVPAHVARYDDSFNPRAFGDLMQNWGTSTVLIEAGGWAGDPEKQFLRAVNFTMLMQALAAIAEDGLREEHAAAYESMPENGSLASDLLVRGGTVVAAGLPPLRADIAANFNDSLRRDRATISEIGDLAEVVAIDTLDVSGLFLHFAADVLRSTQAGPILSPGMPLTFIARRGADPASEIVARVEHGRRVR